MQISFWMPVCYAKPQTTHQLLIENIDDFFYLGLHDYHKAEVVAPSNERSAEGVRLIKASPSCLHIAIKVCMYFTVAIPLIVLLLKYVLRSIHQFYLINQNSNANIQQMTPPHQNTTPETNVTKTPSLSDPEQTKRDNTKELFQAIRNCQVTKAVELIKNGVDLDAHDYEGLTPLILAVNTRQPSIVQSLIAVGAKLEGRDNLECSGSTPLIWAASLNFPEIVEILLNARADINAQDNNGETSLHWAYQRNYEQTYEILHKRGAQWDISTGCEINAMRELARIWGIRGEATFNNGKRVTREDSPPLRYPAFITINESLQAYVKAHPEHRIPNVHEIITTFQKNAINSEALLNSIQKGETVVLKSGPRSHSIVLVFHQGYLAICNRVKDYPTKVYKIDTTTINLDLVKTLLQQKSQGNIQHSFDFIYNKLPNALKASENDEVSQAFNKNKEPLQKSQKAPFCSWNSSEAALFTLIALQKVLAEGQKSDLAKAIREAKTIYKECTTYFRLNTLQKYIEQCENNRIRREYCDFGLITIIRSRLQNPEWHPERFAHPFFKNFRDKILQQINDLIIKSIFNN